jgi:hypothetical protein
LKESIFGDEKVLDFKGFFSVAVKRRGNAALFCSGLLGKS